MRIRATHAIKNLAAFMLAGFFIFSPLFVFAATNDPFGLAWIGKSTDIRLIIVGVIDLILGFLGILAVGIVLYGGFTWMTAAGSEEKIESAKKIIINGVIGLLIVLSAFSIVTFLLSRLSQSILGSNIGATQTSMTNPIQSLSQASFSGGGTSVIDNTIIKSHYPAANEIGVARNASIVITFNEVMDEKSIIKDDGMINSANLKIRKSSDDTNNGPFLEKIKVKISDDKKTYFFKPDSSLGLPDNPVKYSVVLTSAIKKTNGDAAFRLNTFYEWSFETSVLEDLTPLKVISSIPEKDSIASRNSLLQINFNKELDPIYSVGDTTNGFNKIEVKDVKNNILIQGVFSISSDYRVLTFQPKNKCGSNSCGQDIFCFPDPGVTPSAIKVTIKSANLIDSENTESFQAKQPYDGLVDIFGNTLDGGPDNLADGKAQGQPKDNYDWQFKVEKNVDATQPVILSTSPARNATNVDLDKPIEIVFNKYLSNDSITNKTIYFEPKINQWFDVSYSEEAGQKKTKILINHDKFIDNKIYSPKITAELKDIYQNCYYPCSGPVPTSH